MKASLPLFGLRAGALSLAVTSLLAMGGCARTAQLEVLRPALINASAFGNSFEVRGFQGDPQAAMQVQSSLRARIASSLNHAITLVMANGGLAVQGVITRFDYHQEEQRRSDTCSHTETTNGQERSVNHPCTTITISGIVNAGVSFTVLAPATGQVIFSREYSAQTRGEMTRREGPYPQDNVIRGQINVSELQHNSLEQTVDQFARVILPWRDTVEVTFEGCAGDGRCTQAYDAVQAQRLDVAEQILTTVTGADGAPVSEQDRNRVSEAIFNRAMVRMLRGNYGAAFIDLQRAIELRPDKEEWRGRFQQLEQLARDQETMRAQQGLQPAGDQPVPVDSGQPPVGQSAPAPQGAPSAAPAAR
jgi:hypothetical protein